MASPPLDQTGLIHPKSPKWFRDVISNLQYEDHIVEVPDKHNATPCGIRYQLFHPPSTVKKRCGVVLVHGGGAHSRWWDWTAPFLAKDGHTVACLDMSGQGESQRREVYSMHTNMLEVMAVARNLVSEHGAPPEEKPVVIGHSFGGAVALLCGQHHGDELGGIVLLDSFVYRGDTDSDPRPPMRKTRPGAKSPEDMRKRFRLVPVQPVSNDFLLDYIFPLSIAEKDKLFIWKDDAARMKKTIYTGMKEPIGDKPIQISKEEIQRISDLNVQRFHGIKCKLTFCYGAKSFFFQDPTLLDFLKQQLDEHRPGGEAFTPIIEIPDAYHHVMFDQPLVTTTTLRTILGEWHRTHTPMYMAKL